MEEISPHRAIFVVGTEKTASREDPVQPATHRALIGVVREAFAGAGIDLASEADDVEDTGEEVMVTIAPEYRPQLIDDVVRNLDRVLRRRVSRGGQRLRLRAAVHEGAVGAVEQVGPARNEASRLLGSGVLRDVLRDNPRADVALMVSDRSYQRAVVPKYATLDPDWFAPVDVRVKEHQARAWVHVPGEGRPRLGPGQVADAGPAGTPGDGGIPGEEEAGVASRAAPFVEGSGNQEQAMYGGMNHAQTNTGRDVVSGHHVQARDARGDAHLG